MGVYWFWMISPLYPTSYHSSVPRNIECADEQNKAYILLSISPILFGFEPILWNGLHPLLEMIKLSTFCRTKG